ncbi:MAG TPA: isoaspartyl peptidase/L-asparaginase [Pyrinomonadaceae bacterium]|nr:isoaspartyl peptidase/L-asparaginase [Pyrinomonadaceae bacterium]
MNQTKTAIAVHGGAGTILKSEMTFSLEDEYRDGLETALREGWKILQNGGSALDAVEAAVVALEDFPLFNAGRGAVFNHDGKNEMDACLMNGENRETGAVAFIRNVKNPIKVARLVMERTEHILLAGTGANEFAEEMNIGFEPDEYFFTEVRYQQLLKARRENTVQLDHTVEESEINASKSALEKEKKFGTVGAVACDAKGNVAAATSTGGMTNKKFGRIGDTPLVGAGTYADNNTCAVSCTGHGEFFMTELAAYDVAALMKYKNLNLKDAAIEVVEKLRVIGGEGGLIAVDSGGNLALPFNSAGMYRGFITPDGKTEIKIYRD